MIPLKYIPFPSPMYFFDREQFFLKSPRKYKACLSSLHWEEKKNVSQVTVCRYSTKKNIPKISKQYSIADAVPLLLLVCGTDGFVVVTVMSCCFVVALCSLMYKALSLSLFHIFFFKSAIHMLTTGDCVWELVCVCFC